MRTSDEIIDDIVKRLTSKEIIPEFILRTEDYILFCQAIAKAYEPYITQLEYLNEIYEQESLLKMYLLKRNMFLKGTENLTELRNIANNQIAILKSRGTLKQKSELGRLFNVDVTDTNVFQHKVFNMTEVGWNLRNTSPGYKNLFNNTVCMSSLRLSEMYIIWSNNRSKYTDKQILKFLKEKFFNVNINSHWNKRYDFITLGILYKTMFNDYILSDSYAANSFKIRFIFRNLKKDIEDIVRILTIKDDLNDFITIDYDFSIENLIITCGNDIKNINFIFVKEKKYVFDLYFDVNKIKVVMIYVNGDNIYNCFESLILPGNDTSIIFGVVDNTNLFYVTLEYLRIWTKKFQNIIYDFSNCLDLNVKPSNNRNYENSNLNFILVEN